MFVEIPIKFAEDLSQNTLEPFKKQFLSLLFYMFPYASSLYVLSPTINLIHTRNKHEFPGNADSSTCILEQNIVHQFHYFFHIF